MVRAADRRGDAPPVDRAQVGRRAWPCACRARAGAPLHRRLHRAPRGVPGYVDILPGIFDREKVEAVMYGHAGDGNIHTRPILDLKNAADLRTMQRLYDEVSGYVRGIRGTMSGEHGDGLLRTPYVRQIYGDEIYSLSLSVKNAFDPEGL